MPLLRPLVLSVMVLSSAASAGTCSVANRLNLDAYRAAVQADGSEAGQDNSAYDWAQCRAAALDASLAAYPRLQARIRALRVDYRKLREMESTFAGVRAGGGTMYGHAIPRSFAPLEAQLAVLAGLARTSAGGVTSQASRQTVQGAAAAQARYIAQLRAYRPGPDEDYVQFDPASWRRDVDAYERVSKRVMQTLGNRGDAATAQGYRMVTDWVFPATGW